MNGLRYPSMVCLVSFALAACTSVKPPLTSLTSYEAKGVATEAWLYRGGRVVSHDFYPRSFLDDPRWEAYRLRVARGEQAADWRLLRRDVRWYPSPFSNREACAAVFYTLAPADATTVQLKQVEIGRLEALSNESDSPDPVRCTPDGRVWYPRSPDDGLSARERNLALSIDPGATCAGRDSSDVIPINPLERVALRMRVHPMIAKLPGADFDYGQRLPSIPKAALYRAFSAREKPSPVFLRLSPARDRAPVKITETVGPGTGRAPYCVRLTVQRGSQVWSHAVFRAGLLPLSKRPATDKYGRSIDPAYWTPLTDATALADRFAATLRIDP